MYCKPEILKALIIQAQRDGRVSEALALLVEKIGRGVWSRFFRHQDPDDFAQRVVLQIIRKYGTCDTSRPASEIFSWCTKISRSIGIEEVKRAGIERDGMRSMVTVLGDKIPAK